MEVRETHCRALCILSVKLLGLWRERECFRVCPVSMQQFWIEGKSADVEKDLRKAGCVMGGAVAPLNCFREKMMHI